MCAYVWIPNAYLNWAPKPSWDFSPFLPRMATQKGWLKHSDAWETSLSLPHKQSGFPEGFEDAEGSCSLSSCATGKVDYWDTCNGVDGAEPVSGGKRSFSPGFRGYLPIFKPVSCLSEPYSSNRKPVLDAESTCGRHREYSPPSDGLAALGRSQYVAYW